MNTIHYYEENYVKIFNAVTNPNWRVWKTVDEDEYETVYKYTKVK